MDLGEKEARANTDQHDVVRSLITELGKHGGSISIKSNSERLAAEACCRWDDESYQRFKDSRAAPEFLIVFDPPVSFERLRNELLPHEVAHAVQMAESSLDLQSELRSLNLRRGLLCLFTHPRVFELQVAHGMNADHLLRWHEAGYPNGEPPTGAMADDDHYMGWLNSSLSAMTQADAFHWVRSKVVDYPNLESATVRLLATIAKGVDQLESLNCFRSHADTASHIWSEEIKPAVFDELRRTS